MKTIINKIKSWHAYWVWIEQEKMKAAIHNCSGAGLMSILLLVVFTSCERQIEFEQVCCDWDAVNFDPNHNGHNVNQLYFTGSDLCNNDLCLYP